MKSVPYEKIEQEFKGWESTQTDNRQRGENAIDFFIADNMWDGSVVSSRESRNQESLTFNQTIKHLRRLYTQLAEIEFTLDLSPLTNQASEDVTETAALRLLLGSILLSDEVRTKLTSTGRKCADYGQAFIEVNFGYENYETLNLEPKLKLHKDPGIGFWDKNATHQTKIDGRFCGYLMMLTDKELIEKYPDVKDASWLKPSDNKVYNYWWRVYTETEYVTLKSGVEKRIDLLTGEDKANIKRGENRKVISRPGQICEIYFQRSASRKVLEKPRKFPTQDLPLVYHPALTFWHPRHGDVSMPYLQYLMGAQKFHNYLLSQAATQSKSCNADKWFFSNEHVQTMTQRQNAQEINIRDGGFTFGGDIQTIQRHQPMQISQQLIELAGFTKQEIDEINGAMIDTQNAQQTVISAQALERITSNMEAINTWFLEGHICFVNTVGKLYRQMLPELYTQERTLMVRNQDGEGRAIVINQDAGTGKLINNIKDVNNNYAYEIKAGGNTTMQKKETIQSLENVYAIDPQMFRATSHIYFRNLQTKDAGELSRIAIALGDQALIKYSQGEINWNEYQQAKSQEQEQQMKTQMQTAQFDPQVQAAKALAEAQAMKARADEYNAETKRLEAINKAQQAQLELQMKYMLIMTGDNTENRKHELSELRVQIAQNQQMLDILRADQKEQELENERLSRDTERA